ncbi:DUF3526 domain-containing protein [Polaribacter sargassicola]|uniref:DUF3526 domain-containing protein n=1 Tax=Polaribacter sargassicola TaxID=2836891 RepID=UPI001F1D14CF|nr:DUF3526 domain-containing protein [Polaribacter sp. DS7-9]MCG1037572.1 ABC transporter permease [Polaribacter sp. DS7-9]
MIFQIIKKEVQEILRDGRFKISFFIVLFLLVASVFITSKQYSSINEQYDSAEKNERTVWESQGAKNPHSAAHFGNYVFKPKLPLSLLDQGVDKYTGISIFLEAHNRNQAQYSTATDQTALSRFGELTPDFILFFIIPLIIILVGYNSFTKEIEGRTFYIIKSQGVDGWKLVIGKWIAALIPTLIITTLLFLIAGIILSNIKGFGVFSWSSFGILYLIYLIYYFIFTNVILLISSISKKSGIALVSSLTFWVLACFIAPKIASNIADSKYPYPTQQEFSENIAKEKSEGLDGHNPWNQKSKELEEKVLKEHNVNSVNDLPFNYSAYRMQKSEEYQAEIYAKHYKKLKNQFKKQSSIYKTLAVISPFLPARFLSMSIANTDYQSHINFSDAAEDYRIKTQAFLNGNTEKNSKIGERYVASADTWKDLPRFEYTPASLSEKLNENTSNFVILFLWFSVTGGLLFLTNKNY